MADVRDVNRLKAMTWIEVCGLIVACIAGMALLIPVSLWRAIMGRKVAWGLLLLTSPAWAGIYTPELPYITMGQTWTGGSSSISVSLYDEPFELQTVNQLSDTVFLNAPRPLREWGLSVNAHGGVAPYWRVDLEVSNDDGAWTRILRHESSNSKGGGTPAGEMVWGSHKTARRARVNISGVSGTPYLTVTAYAAP